MLATGLLASAGCHYFKSKPNPDWVATVNGKPITKAELDRVYTAQTRNASGTIPALQAERLRLGLADELITRDALLQYAAKRGITASKDKIDKELPTARLREPGTPDNQLRIDIADQIVLQELFKREVDNKITVSDQEVQDFYNQNQAQFRTTEPSYHVRVIAVSSTPGQVNNLKHDKAQNAQQAKQKLAKIEKLLKSGQSFSSVAEQYSEDPNSASSGGDMGIITQSQLMQHTTPAPLRDAVLALKPGGVSAPVQNKGAYYIVKLVDKEAPGQQPLSAVKDRIQQMLKNAREQMVKSAFIAVVRDNARVHDYLAQQVFKSGGAAQ